MFDNFFIALARRVDERAGLLICAVCSAFVGAGFLAALAWLLKTVSC